MAHKPLKYINSSRATFSDFRATSCQKGLYRAILLAVGRLKFDDLLVESHIACIQEQL
jgi:hypothetical protein